MGGKRERRRERRGAKVLERGKGRGQDEAGK